MASVYKDFVFNMKRLMAQHGMSALELSRRCGVADTRLSAMLRQYENPTLETMESIAASLGVPFLEMFKKPFSSPVNDLHIDLPSGYDRVNVILPSFRAFQVRQWGLQAEKILAQEGFNVRKTDRRQAAVSVENNRRIAERRVINPSNPP